MKLAELLASPKYSFEILMGVVSRFLVDLVGVVRLTLLLSLVFNYSSETARWGLKTRFLVVLRSLLISEAELLLREDLSFC